MAKAKLSRFTGRVGPGEFFESLYDGGNVAIMVPLPFCQQKIGHKKEISRRQPSPDRNPSVSPVPSLGSVYRSPPPLARLLDAWEPGGRKGVEGRVHEKEPWTCPSLPFPARSLFRRTFAVSHPQI
ncbi:hypothetical protein MUK42_33579 [Musa troglodytarum]|uniref:Uncharacterized protein n=1 Tax=Musa troglodytarum TaxID=320322 RepID=A0A9E7FDN1_9LILI|nr:hypothetical protein MUK42_33579 [Musa troglodytarum]